MYMECDAVLFCTNVSEKITLSIFRVEDSSSFHVQDRNASTGCPETLSIIYQTSRRHIAELVWVDKKCIWT